MNQGFQSLSKRLDRCMERQLCYSGMLSLLCVNCVDFGAYSVLWQR